MNVQAVIDFQNAVVSAIARERAVSPSEEMFRLAQVFPVPGRGTKLRLAPADGVIDDVAPVIDDRFRQCLGKWVSIDGQPHRRSVILDDATDDEILIRDANPSAFEGVTTITLACFDFLYQTQRLWNDPGLAQIALSSFLAMQEPQLTQEVDLSEHAVVDELMEGQRDALKLVNHEHAWLFGPPGTGKTQTSAVMLAAFLMNNPHARILVVGISNAPLCQLVDRLDEVLKRAGRNDLRRWVRRYGSGTTEALRRSRPHLLPNTVDAFMPAEVDLSMDTWDIEIPRGPEVVSPRLYAMTVSTALQKHAALQELGKFDLLLIEEASQAPLCQTLLLCALAKSTIYAGDPRQLSPVAKSPEESVRKWMATSPMDLMPDLGLDMVTMLREQQRMAPEICALVSAIGYEGQLTTAEMCLFCSKWMLDRSKPFAEFDADQSIVHVTVGSEREGHRCARKTSTTEVVRLVQAGLQDGMQAREFLVLTPFRAQVHLIKRALTATGLYGVRVSTVHKVQGKEASVVLFDPVLGTHPFLKTDEARRLLTVAFSRAEAKLVMVASQADLANPILQQLAEAARKCQRGKGFTGE